VDKLAVVARQPKEPAHCAHQAGRGPVTHDLHLGRIHGDTSRRDDVPQVRDRVDAERALGTLDEEPVLPQNGEDDASVSELVHPGRAVDEYVIEKDKHKLAEEGA
jgi:hypothetical protein